MIEPYFSGSTSNWPRSGTIDTWHLPHNVELLLAKKPIVGTPNPPRRPLPVLDPIDLRDEDQQPEEANLDEAQEMEQLDYDVINIDIRTTRGTVQQQVCRGASLEDLVNHYARAKKVRPQRCSPYVPVSDHILNDDQEVVILINQPARGGQNVFVRQHSQWLDIELLPREKVRDFMLRHDWQMRYLLYKGAEVRNSVVIEDLKSDQFELVLQAPPTWLRSRQQRLATHIITLIELTEWFAPQDDDHNWAETDILQSSIHNYNRIKAQSWWTTSTQQRLARGGGKKGGGHLVWESTRTITGLRLLTEISASQTVLQSISVDEVTKDATGAAMVLINTWNVHLKGIEAQKPLVLLFPGRCRDALTRLGASPGCLGEAELLYCEESSGRTFKRQTTTLSLSDNAYLFGCALRSVDWAPSASAEYQLELDTRWSGQAILDAAQSDWRSLVAKLASQIAVSNIPKEDFYALRSPTSAPLVWSARVRLPPEAGEKLLCGSGLESLFVRHADTEMEEQKKNYTVIWGPKHTDCSAQALTQLQQMSADFAGHRGIARSAIGLGLRVQWSDVAKARRALRPNDPCLNDANISIADKDLYFMERQQQRQRQRYPNFSLRLDGLQ